MYISLLALKMIKKINGKSEKYFSTYFSRQNKDGRMLSDKQQRKVEDALYPE